MTFSERVSQMTKAELEELAERRMERGESIFAAICTGISVSTIVLLVWLARVPPIDTEINQGVPHGQKILTQR